MFGHHCSKVVRGSNLFVATNFLLGKLLKNWMFEEHCFNLAYQQITRDKVVRGSNLLLESNLLLWTKKNDV